MTAVIITQGHNRYNLDFRAINAACRPYIEQIARELFPDGKQEGRYWVPRNHTRYDENRGSLKIDLESGTWKDYATNDSGGDIISLAAYAHNNRQSDAARWVSERYLLGAGMANVCHTSAHTHQPPSLPECFEKRRMAAISRLWNNATATRDDRVQRYLASRGWHRSDYPPVLRFSPRTYCRTGDSEIFLPAMVARVDSPEGNLVSVHRTYLDPTGVGKAAIDEPKRLMPSTSPGVTRGAAIRLFPAGNVLGLAEGIETALACHMATAIPIWACISAPGMENVSIPEQVEHVVIFADNDRSLRGERAAFKLSRQLAQEGRSSEIRIPAGQGEDFADQLLKTQGQRI